MASPVMNARANTIAHSKMAQRTTSIDSNISSISTTSAALRPAPNSVLRAPQDAASQLDAASLIASTGSAEAALDKVLAEKQQLTSHNAQLWRLVEKQRSMLLGLGKDLEKMTKEKERYKRKLKEQLAHGTSMSSIMTGQTDEILDRDDSQSPALVDGHRVSPNDINKGMRKSSDTSEAGVSGVGRSDTPQDATTIHSLGRSGAPHSTSSSPLSTPQELERPLANAAPVLPPAPLNISAANSAYAPSKKVDPSSMAAQDLPSPSAQSPMPNSPQSLLSSPKTRKAPPAPLKLARQPTNEAPQEIVDASDSDYELDADGARVEYQERGRRKTREEDDRVREKSHQAEEDELRSRSNKENKQSKSRPAVEHPPIPAAVLNTQTQDNANVARQKAPAFQSMVNPADIVRNRVVSDMQRNMVAPSILSPGLPMSPRPGDRPLLSPMPRAPMGLGGMPMSPKPGMSAFPLSPRAPRQAIPMPPQTPSAISYPHLDRAAAYHQQTQAPSQQAAAQTTDQSRSTASAGSEAARVMHDQTPGEIYMGFVSDAYPDLLLPPNALPSIYIKTTSPRMKPSRQSFIAPRPGEENPVFTVAVYERSANKQLWRIEKTYQSLAVLDQQVKAVSTVQARLPDRTLFIGHAPAKIDARRQVIDQYLGHLLESVYEERAAKIVCSFLSTDAFGAEPSEYFGAPPEPKQADAPVRKLRQNRSGYLTKRGKNFGGWKARFFVLDGPNLKYFEGPGGAQLGAIKLQNAQIGKQSTTAASTTEDEENQYRHAFLILEPKKKDSNSLVRHVLCAESDEERDAWVESLLQYVDFKDDEAHPGLQAQVWKSEITGPRSPRLQKSLNDLRSNGASRPSDLRAVQYNELTAGEAPIMGPPLSPRIAEPSSPGFDRLEHANGAAHPVISRPSNLQVIQNASDWGNKQPPPTPGSRDKKRNVFTLPFSSKGRSSSDLPANERPSTAGVQRAVFGVELALAVEYAHPADVATDLPAVVYRCIEYLTAQNAVAEEGIFRLSGSNTVIKSLKERFNTEGDIDLLAEDNYYDIHAVASLLKLYLRELPSSILTRELHLEFLKSLELAHEDKVITVNILINKLPPANRALVEALSGFMLLIVDNVAVNRMNVRNRKFSPDEPHDNFSLQILI
jgi:RalA-binding protein 1